MASSAHHKPPPTLVFNVSLPTGEQREFTFPQKFTVDQVKRGILNQTLPNYRHSDWFLVLNDEEVLDIEFRKIENAHKKIKDAIQNHENVSLTLISRLTFKRRSTPSTFSISRLDELPERMRSTQQSISQSNSHNNVQHPPTQNSLYQTQIHSTSHHSLLPTSSSSSQSPYIQLLSPRNQRSYPINFTSNNNNSNNNNVEREPSSSLPSQSSAFPSSSETTVVDKLKLKLDMSTIKEERSPPVPQRSPPSSIQPSPRSSSTLPRQITSPRPITVSPRTFAQQRAPSPRGPEISERTKPKEDEKPKQLSPRVVNSQVSHPIEQSQANTAPNVANSSGQPVPGHALHSGISPQLHLVTPWNRILIGGGVDQIPEKHRQRNTKIREILKKSFTQLPIRNDFPRFAKRIFLCMIDGFILLDPTEESAADYETVERVIALLTIMSKHLEGNEDVDIGGDVHLPSFLEQLGGDESPVVRILKACNQDAIAPAVIELKMALGVKNMTKDVPNSWFFHILLPPYDHNGSTHPNGSNNNPNNNNKEGEFAIVHCEKREQDLKSQFNYKWELWLYFDKNIKECKEIYLCITDISFSDSVEKERIFEILSLLKLYLHPSICEKYNFVEGC